MCGILAVINFDGRPIDERLLYRMRDTMTHRGPDGAGVYVDGHVGLAHRRLAIIDLSETGHQPMCNEDQSVFLVFNGEIYNYLELRKDLFAQGHVFHSTSDTEVILHQYEEDGEECLSKLNGMFAFVLWDRRRKRLFGARDRLGIKPLYYYFDEKRMILASEIKAIVEDTGVPRQPDYQAIADYCFAGRPLGGKTVFRHIREVLPGFMLSVDGPSGQMRTRRYWDLTYAYNYSRSGSQRQEELFSLLEDSARLHCRSDAPLGCHLSGGLDSSTVAALAARHRQGVNCFSIKFSDDPFTDETAYAKAVAGHIGGRYHEESPTATDFVHLFPFLIWHMDMPMANRGGFSYFSVSHLASKTVKVCLTGHGGDELFAGYPAQFRAAYGNVDMFKLHVDPERKRPGLWREILERILHKNPAQLYHSLSRRLGNAPRSLEEVWIGLHCGSLPQDYTIFQRSFLEVLEGYSPRDEYVRPFSHVASAEMIDRCLYHDLTVYLPSLLHLEDRVSMAVSLESRVPLLDHRIAEWLATVPPAHKLEEIMPKYLLRLVASRLLPDGVWNRKDKVPFAAPGKMLKSRHIREMARRILLSPESMGRGIFSPKALKNACEEIEQGWTLMNVELWFKLFMDQDSQWLTLTGLKTHDG